MSAVANLQPYAKLQALLTATAVLAETKDFMFPGLISVPYLPGKVSRITLYKEGSPIAVDDHFYDAPASYEGVTITLEEDGEGTAQVVFQAGTYSFSRSEPIVDWDGVMLYAVLSMEY